MDGKLDQVINWLALQPFSSELILVDDGSQDNTALLAESYSCTVVRIAHAGKAAALVAGIRKASGHVVLFMDMDQATPVSEAPKLLERLDSRTSVAIGSRGLARPGAPAGRYLISWGQMLLRSLFIGLKLTDTQCGFKAFYRKAAEDILQRLRVYHPDRARHFRGPSVTSGFDVEMLFVANRLGYRIAEVPVIWHYRNTRRINMIRDTWRGVTDLCKILKTDLARQYPKAGLPTVSHPIEPSPR